VLDLPILFYLYYLIKDENKIPGESRRESLLFREIPGLMASLGVRSPSCIPLFMDKSQKWKDLKLKEYTFPFIFMSGWSGL
jgi:hypothetical protein